MNTHLHVKPSHVGLPLEELLHGAAKVSGGLVGREAVLVAGSAAGHAELDGVGSRRRVVLILLAGLGVGKVLSSGGLGLHRRFRLVLLAVDGGLGAAFSSVGSFPEAFLLLQGSILLPDRQGVGPGEV